MSREGAARRPLSFKGYARTADREHMASQLRLQMLAPIAVVAILGLAVSAFIMSRNKPGGSDAGAIAARIAARQHHTSGTPPKTDTHPTPTTPAPTHAQTHSGPKPASHGTSLKTALAHHSVVVVLFYEPRADYDSIQTREARAAAITANAGFLSVNVSKNKQVAKMAAEYNVLESPTVLVFKRGPKLTARFEGYYDRATIVQAVENA
jgi:hypothetical protein